MRNYLNKARVFHCLVLAYKPNSNILRRLTDDDFKDDVHLFVVLKRSSRKGKADMFILGPT